AAGGVQVTLEVCRARLSVCGAQLEVCRLHGLCRARLEVCMLHWECAEHGWRCACYAGSVQSVVGGVHLSGGVQVTPGVCRVWVEVCTFLEMCSLDRECAERGWS
ncbi:hypothetical protein NDU88_007642, partial [Pleurodeles waltl]